MGALERLDIPNLPHTAWRPELRLAAVLLSLKGKTNHVHNQPTGPTSAVLHMHCGLDADYGI